MLTPEELERERNESRLKAQMDDRTRLKAARMEGREEGLREAREERAIIGMIHCGERLLHRPETPTQELTGIPLDELMRLEDELEEQVSMRMKTSGL